MQKGIAANLYQGDEANRAKRTLDAAKRKARRRARGAAEGQGAARCGQDRCGSREGRSAVLQRRRLRAGCRRVAAAWRRAASPDPDATNMLLGIALKRRATRPARGRRSMRSRIRSSPKWRSSGRSRRAEHRACHAGRRKRPGAGTQVSAPFLPLSSSPMKKPRGLRPRGFFKQDVPVSRAAAAAGAAGVAVPGASASRAWRSRRAPGLDGVERGSGLGRLAEARVRDADAAGWRRRRPRASRHPWPGPSASRPTALS